MNKVTLIGRLTKEPSVSYGQNNQMAIARYTLAIDRRPTKDGQKETDFISCVAFGKSGEFAANYLHQGTKIAVCGRIQTGSYTNKDGQKVYTTDVVAEEHEFVESKSSQTNQPAPVVESSEQINEGFINIPSNASEDGLPFS